MKTYTNPLPKPPPSSHPRPFDPWNSSSTGHQRREASRRETDGVSETSWRASRALKINQQLKTQSHVPPPPPPPPASQERKPTLPQRQQPKSVMEMLVRPGSMKETMSAVAAAAAAAAAAAVAEKEKSEVAGKREESAGQSLIFAGLVVHVNGSTAPLVSDHKLKTLLAAHGARVALHLARRHVTHVVLGRPAGSISGSSGGGSGGGGGGGGSSAGCGGGLAGTKMDREIRRRGGNGIKYVGVEWVLESIRVGRRLPEARFANLDIAPHGQSSVYRLSNKPA
ncbi:brct domain containing protein [Beauveria brongniartii RCEF 3172]|uniref:Brct domain containing protein n=1 Tax=Beauveria brongniartii RCEF 3172 TaxID=1081107 RepID=A0A166WND6_9HYPO|nr:brct domain containing protein [Beauveria brongniartii RCEF 3172]